MTEYSERTVGAEAIDYIRERLSNGKTLARHLLETLDLECGSVITCLPPNVSDQEALQFESGAKLPRPDRATSRYYTDEQGRTSRLEPIPNTDPWLVSLVQDFLSQSASRVCILEEFSFRPSDPLWSKEEARRQAARFVDDEVYYVLLSDDSHRRVEQTVRWSGGAWPGLLAAMTSMTTYEAISSDHRDMSPAQLKTLAERTERLAVGAYDGESYLIWSKARDR
jgi:hypothetical protein